MAETAETTVTLEHTVRITAPPEVVWRFWTEPARLGDWWGFGTDVVPEPGGLFRVVMATGQVMRGTFTEVDPPRRLAFTFGWEHNAPGEALAPGSTSVVVTLTADRDETVLVLRHFEMPADAAAPHDKGWPMFLGMLAAACAASRQA